MWREGTGARVRERLGWATAPEIGAAPPNGGALLYFPMGLMGYAGPVLKKIFVFYSDQGFGSYDLTRWAVYDDTFQGASASGVTLSIPAFRRH